MGTIVINQTDCKQNVVLQSSLDGITGGYYDAAGVWHEFGGGAVEEIKVYVGKGFSGNDIVDDATRAITDPIPFTPADGDNYIQQYVPMNYQAGVRACDSEGNLIATGRVVGTTTNVGQYNVYYSTISEGILLKGSPSAKDDGTGISFIRFQFKNGSAGTDPVASVFDGYAVVSGTLYHLTSN